MQGETLFTRRNISKRTKLVTEDDQEHLEGAAADYRFIQLVRPQTTRIHPCSRVCVQDSGDEGQIKEHHGPSRLVDACLVVSLEIMIF